MVLLCEMVRLFEKVLFIHMYLIYVQTLTLMVYVRKVYVKLFEIIWLTEMV